MLTTLQVWAIVQAQLITLSQVGVWGNIEKPRWDMAFSLLIASSIAIGCVWPHCGVGTSMPSVLPYSTRGGLQTCATSRHKWGLAIHLHTTEWCHDSCTFIRSGACQCHDRQCAQCWCLWPAASVSSAQAVAAQGEGSVSGGLKWGPRGPTVHFPRATSLGCHHSWWSLQGTMISRGGSQPCAAWGHDNCHSGYHHYTGANPLSGWYYWTSLRHCHGHKPASPWSHGMAAVNFPCSIHPISQCSMPRRSHYQQPWGPHPWQKEQKIPLGKRKLGWPAPPQWQPSHRPPTGGHSRWHPQFHPHHSPTTPTSSTTDSRMKSISFIPQHQTPPGVGLAGLTSELLQLQGRMNVAIDWLLTTRATMDSSLQRTGAQHRTHDAPEWGPSH